MSSGGILALGGGIRWDMFDWGNFDVGGQIVKIRGVDKERRK